MSTDINQLEDNQITNDEAPENDEASKKNDYLWLIGCFIITAIAIFFRFWQLELKPLHHDEGVNGYFLKTLFQEGIYKYDPSNYHGPTLYYIALAFSKVFGLEIFSIRASVAVFGVFIVILTFFLRKYIGSVGSLAAALLLALSPGMVYISRYFIHEIFFVFCTLGIVLGILFFIEGRKAGIFAAAWMALLLLICFLPAAMYLPALIGEQNTTLVLILRISLFALVAAFTFFLMRALLNWDEGRPIYLLLASASAALFFATKETAFITIGTMVLACVCVWLWRKIYPGMLGKIKESWREPVALTWSNFRARFRERDDSLLLWASAALIFIYVGALFFSSFFTYPAGIVGAFKAYAFWTKTGSGEHTQNGYLAYAKWLWKIESPILFFSAIGTLIALVKARHRFALFAGFWAYGIFAAYTIIPYKTPWLALSFILPMCLVAGYGINELAIDRDYFQKGLAGLFMVVAVAILGYQTYDLSFERYDDDRMPYVYAHTRRGFLDMLKQIEYYENKSGKGKDITIEVVSPDYWSMPWYTIPYPNAHYPSKVTPINAAEIIIAKKAEQDEDITREYTAHYKCVGTYPLRPGVDLYLLVRRDLADPGTKEISEVVGSDSSVK